MAGRPPRFIFQTFAVVAGFVFVLAACSRGGDDGTPETLDQFCSRATEYLRFEPSLGRVANDPEQTQVFISAWQDRLVVLEERAPDDIREDVRAIKTSVDELDDELVTVGYDLLALSLEQLDNLDALAEGEGSGADRRFRGYVDANCTTAPSALTDEQLAELLADDEDIDIDGEVTAAMAEELEVALGISPDVSTCLASNLEPDVLDELLGGADGGEQAAGGQMSEDTIDALIDVIDLCGITADDLIGG